MFIANLTLLIFSIVLIVIFTLEYLPAAWKVHKKGNVMKNNDHFGIVIIEKNKITKSVRAYILVNAEKTLIEVSDAEKIIG
jgi:hypothetical protein